MSLCKARLEAWAHTNDQCDISANRLFEELYKKNCQQSENSNQTTLLPRKSQCHFLED